MRNTTFLKLVAVTTAITLSGCGGGGTETSAPDPEPVTTAPAPTPAPTPVATLSLNAPNSITVNERSDAQVTVDIDYTGSEALSATLSDVSIDNISLERNLREESLVLTISAAELTGLATESDAMIITITDGTLSESVEVNVTAKNTSFSEVVSAATEALDGLDSINVTGEVENISIYLSDKAYLYGIIDNNEKEEWLATTVGLADSAQNSIKQTSGELYTAIIENRDTLTETEAEQQLRSANESLNNAGDAFAPIINAYESLAVPNFTVPDYLALTNFDGQYSLFYGNPAVGTGTSTDWSFSTDFQLLSELLPLDSTLCLADNNA